MDTESEKDRQFRITSNANLQLSPKGNDYVDSRNKFFKHTMQSKDSGR